MAPTFELVPYERLGPVAFGASPDTVRRSVGGKCESPGAYGYSSDDFPAAGVIVTYDKFRRADSCTLITAFLEYRGVVLGGPDVMLSEIWNALPAWDEADEWTNGEGLVLPAVGLAITTGLSPSREEDQAVHLIEAFSREGFPERDDSPS